MSTVIILGAGASSIYKYPLGKNLLTSVRSESERKKAEKSYANLWDIIKRNEYYSIDKFMHDNPVFADQIKSIIIEILLRSENERMLNECSDEENIYKTISYHLNNNEAKDLNFITFNYDRSLEFYLLRSFSRKYKNKKELDSFFNTKERIIHVHGRLPDLLLEIDTTVTNMTDTMQMVSNYGFTNSLLEQSDYAPEYILKNIITESKKTFKTIYENSQINERSIDLLKKAKSIFFLGFGYDFSNLDIFGDVFKIPNTDQLVVGTKYKLSIIDENRVKNRYLNIDKLIDCECNQLFNEHIDLIDVNYNFNKHRSNLKQNIIDHDIKERSNRIF